MKTATVVVRSVEITHRAVEVPTSCPGCGADLTQEHALKFWAGGSVVMGSLRAGATTTPHCDFEEDPETLNWHDGAEAVATVFTCAGCGKTIAEGEEEEIAMVVVSEEERGRVEQEATTWSREVDELHVRKNPVILAEADGGYWVRASLYVPGREAGSSSPGGAVVAQ